MRGHPIGTGPFKFGEFFYSIKKEGTPAIAAHSSKSPVASSAGARCNEVTDCSAQSGQVIPAAVAMNTHFSHISCRIASLRRASKRVPDSCASDGKSV